MLVKRIAVYNTIYPSIFNRLRAIVRYWSKIAFNDPVEGDPLGQTSLFLVDE